MGGTGSAPGIGDGAGTDGSAAARLRDLLAECIERITLEGDAAARPILDANPEFAAALRQRLDKLRVVGLLDADSGGPAALPERLGDFRLIRKIGSGGMGVVYLAVQEGLGREVALKLVRPEQLHFGGARERFQREVTAIARLNDPGIVPIHTVGEDRGIPYFAMQHVRGASLAEVIQGARARSRDGAVRLAELRGSDIEEIVAAHAATERDEPTPERAGPRAETFTGAWVQACCRIVAAMARAAQHAHERGVIHRDLKPSNAMVTPDGRVLLLDFGLAAAEGAPALTLAGGFVGTLHYTAPEQLLGQGTDARTDVYSLGVTLYELLALRAPFEAPTAEPLRHAILVGHAPPLARLNPAVPRDLETICRKAIEREPARRYATAQSLADDLAAFLGHGPILARPAGPWLRLRRLVRRHPGRSAALAAAAVTCCAVGLTLLDQARSHAVERAHLDRTLTAISRLLEQARDPRLAAAPGLDAMRESQLEDAVRLIDDLDRATGDGDAALLLARGRLQIAELQLQLGRPRLADASAHDAQEQLAALDAAEPGRVPVLALLGGVAVLRGQVARETGDLEAAAARWQHGVDMLLPLAQRDDASPSLLRSLGACLTNLAILRQIARDPTQAEALLRQALALGRRTAVSPDPGLVLDIARTRLNLANVLSQQGRAADARSEFEQVVADLAVHGWTDPEARRELARARVGAGRAARAAGDAARAAELFDAAQQDFDHLAAEFVDRAAYQWERAMVELERATANDADRDASGAERGYRAAIAHLEDLQQRFPDRSDTPGELAVALSRLADLLARTGHEDDAVPLYGAAVVQLQRAADADAEGTWGAQLALGLSNHGQWLLRSGDPAASRATLERAAAQFERAAPDSPARREVQRFLAYACVATDDPDAAIRALSAMAALAPTTRAELLHIGDQLHLGELAAFQELLQRMGPR